MYTNDSCTYFDGTIIYVHLNFLPLKIVTEIYGVILEIAVDTFISSSFLVLQIIKFTLIFDFKLCNVVTADCFN